MASEGTKRARGSRARKALPAFSVAVVILAAASTASAQGGIRVQESGGVDFQSPTGGPTEVFFVSSDPEDVVAVENILAEETAVAVGQGGSATAWSTRTQKLCETPCRLQLDPGHYRLQLGIVAFDKTMDLNVSGGTKAYEIDAGSGGAFLGGFILGMAGTVAALVSPIMLLIDTTPFLIMGGIGLAMAIPGWLLHASGAGDVREIPPQNVQGGFQPAAAQ